MGQIVFQKKDKIPAVSVILKKAKATDAHGYVKLRVKHKIRKEPYLVALGHRVEEKHWDTKRDRVKQAHQSAHTINNSIDTEEARVKHAFAEYVDGGGKITEAVIEAVLTGAEVREGDFLQFMKGRIEFKAAPDKQGDTPLSADYIEHIWVEYRQLLKYTKGYLSFSSITLSWLEQYELYHRPKVVATTLHTRMKRVMEYVNLAVDRGLIPKEQVAGYKLPIYVDPERQYLNGEQVEAIENLVYDGHLDFDQTIRSVAAFFVIECYSGLRFSDWPRFRVEKVIKEPALRVRTKKNDEPVYLYLNNWPRLQRMCNYILQNKLVFGLKERETNNSLKTIRALVHAHAKVQIPFEFTTHNGRHTAATFLAMLGYSDFEGSEILGISPDTFAIYRKATRQGSRQAQKRYGGM